VYELIDSPAFLVPLRRCTVTADAHRPAPDIEGANVEERSEATQQDRIVLDLPPSSFTVIEAPTAGLLT
jgi:hypothetical protein